MQRDMSIWQCRSSVDRGNCIMRKTYKCSNVKFCMDDENQRRTWEYLQGITRKDGSYGKVLSDVFAAFLDGQDREKENDEYEPAQAGQVAESETLDQVLEKVMEKMLSEMKEMLSEQIRCCFSEYVQAFYPGAGLAADDLVRTQPEETKEQELSEDMMAFAFGMGE